MGGGKRTDLFDYLPASDCPSQVPVRETAFSRQMSERLFRSRAYSHLGVFFGVPYNYRSYNVGRIHRIVLFSPRRHLGTIWH